MQGKEVRRMACREGKYILCHFLERVEKEREDGAQRGRRVLTGTLKTLLSEQTGFGASNPIWGMYGLKELDPYLFLMSEGGLDN